MKSSSSAVRLAACCLTTLLASWASAAPYQLGECSVAQNATGTDNVCVDVRGKAATGVAPGDSHDACTAAKANARTNLLTGIPAACGAYIQCGNPCRTIQK